jgi:hypothetical protein
MMLSACLRKEIEKIGYTAIVDDYLFSDVFAAPTVNRRVPIAAFTHTPYSYRNAALAVVHAEAVQPAETVSKYRALGAPLVFVIKGEDVSIWQVRSEVGPRQLGSASQDQLAQLFSEHSEEWAPLSIQRAKSIGQFRPEYQLHFVDLGLLPAIEGEIHTRLDRLLQQALGEAIDWKTGITRHVKERRLFHAVFRFLAAKILQDRLHPLSQTWDSEKIETMLDSISSFYSLDALQVRPSTAEYRVLSSVWQRIRGGINFQNISADDLAFVYENTLVTREIRERFGTHSTPRQIAEYIVCHLDLHNYEPKDLRIYEPFAGAAVFLVSALRHLRERLPVEWSDVQRHEFLVQRIAGDEIDAFAREVAMLSLILADYPMRNGWHIYETNLFDNGLLTTRMRAHNVILCNPPFEAFADIDRNRAAAQDTHSQAKAALNAALDAHPLALGFVLPRPFILERQFAEQRRRVEKLYGAVELVQVPDRTFRFSDVDAALLIAREPRPPAPPLIKLRSTEVADQDRLTFLKTGEPTITRELVRPVPAEPTGVLWLPPLGKLWSYLEDYPRLRSKLRPRWGLRWTYKQTNAWSDRPREEFQPGVFSAKHHKQFFIGRTVFLDFRPRFVREAYDQEWDKPKLIINATRLSRGPWRLGAFVDLKGLLYSQQFYGLWPNAPLEKHELFALSAILNGPVANAFIYTHSPDYRFRAAAVRRIPIPQLLPMSLGDLVAEYSARLNKPRLLTDPHLPNLLSQIDAAVLKAYDLPPRLERELLELFRRTKRPVAHDWEHWLPENFKPYIPLHRYLSPEYATATSGRILDVLKPLPENEAAALREYLD